MLTLLLAFGYLLSTVLPASWAMRWATDLRWFQGCQRYTNRSRERCVANDGDGCWVEAGQYTPWSIAAGMLVGLIWPLALFPAIAANLAMRKPTPGALQRRIVELEKEVDL